MYDNHMLCNSNEEELQLWAVMFSKPVQLVAREGAVKIQGTESVGHLVFELGWTCQLYLTIFRYISYNIRLDLVWINQLYQAILNSAAF